MNSYGFTYPAAILKRVRNEAVGYSCAPGQRMWSRWRGAARKKRADSCFPIIDFFPENSKITLDNKNTSRTYNYNYNRLNEININTVVI